MKKRISLILGYALRLLRKNYFRLVSIIFLVKAISQIGEPLFWATIGLSIVLNGIHEILSK
jgi:hypothetical protein|tara:strand:+ start:1331 stop:1513 length:183 start_codon:yes stop_codon:yes gene_type:complete